MRKLILSILLFLATITSYAQTATISGKLTDVKKDTLKLVLQVDPIMWKSETFTIILKDGAFRKVLPVTKPTLFYITDGTNYINGLLEAGDDIQVSYNGTDVNGSLSFSGKGKEKHQFLNYYNAINKEYYDRVKQKALLSTAKTTKYPFDFLLNQHDSIQQLLLQKLLRIKPQLTKESYALIEGEIKGRTLSAKFHVISTVYSEGWEETLTKRAGELTPKSKKAITELLKFDEQYASSFGYINSVYNMLFRHHAGLELAGKLEKNIPVKYAYLDKMIPAALKVPVFTMFLEHDLQELNQAEDLEAVIQSVYKGAGNTDYSQFIKNKFTEVKTFRKGKPAPAFTLEDDKGQPVTLATFKGKVVYLDFWYATCVPCHALFQKLKPVKEYFKLNPNVVFLNVSIDDKEEWLKSLQKFKIPGYHVFTQGKEKEHDIIKAYKVASYPTNCIIDPNGNMFSANPPSTPGDLIKEIEAALKEGK